MGKIRRTTHIDVPPDALWRLLVDVERRPEWEATTVGISEVSGPADQVGASWTEARRGIGTLWRRVERTVRVTNNERPRLWEHASTWPGGGSGTVRHVMEPEGEGTRKIVEVEFLVRESPVAPLVDKLVEKIVLGLHARRSEDSLKALAEAEHRRAGAGAPSSVGGG